jgi:hypothetical protein
VSPWPGGRRPATEIRAAVTDCRHKDRGGRPTSPSSPAWTSPYQARLDASAARKEVALLRREFNKFAKQDPIDDKALLKTLLAALQPQEIADIIVGAVPPAVANEAARSVTP